MLSDERKFWENLDVSIEDLRDLTRSKKNLPLRLNNKIKDMPGWLQVINGEYQKEFDSLRDALVWIYSKRKSEFLSLFAIAEFCKYVDVGSIMNRLPTSIIDKYQSGLNEGTVSYHPLLLPLFRYDRNLLVDMFYSVLIDKSSLKTYRADPSIDAKEFLQGLNEAAVTRFFEKLRRERVIRRNVKLWWLKSENDELKLLVRLESVKRKSIRQVSTNIFMKTAGSRIMIFSEKGNKLSVMSKGRDASAKWAGLLISSGLKTPVTYSQVINEFESDKVSEFIAKLKEGQIADVAWRGIKRRNLNVPDSPTITIESGNMGPVNASIRALEEEKNLNMTSDVKDILILEIAIKGRAYKLKTKTNEGITTIIFDNKNIPEAEKDEVETILTNAISRG